MRVGVIGAGAVGGAIAALLARAGHDVEVTGRGDHLGAIRENGIHLRGGWGEYVARVHANELLTRGPELVIVATKAQHAAEALGDNATFLRGIPILVVQNGLDGIATASEAAPRSDIVGALATFASSYLSPGEVTVTATGPTYLGVAADKDDLPARYVARILGSVMPVSIVPNFVGAQWTKLVINQVNGLPAVTGRSVQEVVRDRGLRRVMTASMRETVRTAIRTHIHFEPLQGLGNRGLRLFAALPLWIGQALPALMARRMGRTPNPGSTLQSVRRGQATEIDYLNGSVVRAASAIGRTAPVNALIVEMVHEVEKTGDFATPGAVVERFRAL